MRGGSETYIATARLSYRLFEIVKNRDVLAKAVVTFPSPPDVTAVRWCEKAEILSRIGVNHPEIYSNFNATLYQEFLSSRLLDVWPISSDFEKYDFACDLAKLYAALDAAGFQPISYIFHDLMLRRRTICIVDLGEDLGDWDFKSPHNNGYEAFRKSSYFISENEPDLRELYETHFWRVREIIADY